MICVEHDLGEGQRRVYFHGTRDEMNAQMKEFFSSPVVVYKMVMI